MTPDPITGALDILELARGHLRAGATRAELFDLAIEAAEQGAAEAAREPDNAVEVEHARAVLSALRALRRAGSA
jgi:hypothetical protein